MNSGSIAMIQKWRPSCPMGVTWFSHPKKAQQTPGKIKTMLTVVLIRKVSSITSMPLQVKQLIRYTTSMFFIGWEMQQDENGHSYGQLVIGSFSMTMYPLMHHVLCKDFWWNITSPRWLSPPTAQILHPATSGFPKNWNHLWKGWDFRLSMKFRKT